jgi:hypothetical protein
MNKQKRRKNTKEGKMEGWDEVEKNDNTRKGRQEERKQRKETREEKIKELINKHRRCRNQSSMHFPSSLSVIFP